METWLIFSIASIFFAGMYSFLIKVAAMKNYNPSMVTGYGYLTGAVLAGIFLVIEGLNVGDIKAIISFAFINVLFYFFSTLTRIESMKNIDSVIFFPVFKTVSPILVTIAGLFLFQETLSTKEIIGIILGISVPLLLIGAHENKRQIDLKKGMIFLLISSGLVLISTVMIKQVNILELNVPLFVFFTMIFGYFVSIISNKIVSKKNKNYETKNIFWFAIIMGIFHYASFYCFTRSLEGNLAVAFTVNSFAILIPIILSIIFYKDHFNLKKAFVIFLSIVSIILFI